MRTPSVSAGKSALQGIVLMLFATASLASSISGKVTDAQTGNPLASMVVAAYTTDGTQQVAAATSDSTGRYSITLPGGSYRVLAYDNNGVYATMFFGDAESFESIVPISPDASNINFTLRLGGRIGGSVSTSTGSLAGITVAVYNLDGSRRGSALTDATGAYSLVLPPGSYKVAAYDNAGTFWPKFFQNQNAFVAATVVNVTAGQTSAVSFGLDPAAHIVGSVIDAVTRLPLAAMTVHAYDANGVLYSAITTDASGSFNLRVPGGTFRVVASDAQQTYATAYYGGAAFATATDITVAPGATQSAVQIAMQRAGALSGQVSDTTGAPINVTVAAYGLDGTQRATAQTSNGTFKLLLAPGDYKVAAYDNNLLYATQFYSRQTTFAAATPVTVTSGVTPGPLLLFVLSRGARISGNVIDSDTNATLPGITINAYDANSQVVGTATTDANGNYVFVLPAGTYRFVAFDKSLNYAAAFAGGVSYETAIAQAVVSGSTDTVNFKITRGIHVTGVVRDATGAALSGVEVSALDPNGNHVGTATTKNGLFDLVLLPNQYRFVATDPQSRFPATFAPSTLTVAWGSPTQTVVITVFNKQRRRSVPH
jgi:carboxypeptidase family protein